MFLKGTADQIADQVRAEIESGALAPGSQLSQVQLAERFGLSRIPIREAVRHFTPEIAVRASESLKEMNRASDEAAVRGAHERFHQVLFDAASRPRMAALINDWRFHYQLDKQKAFISKTRDIHRSLLNHCTNADLDAVATCVRAECAIIRRTISAEQAK